MKILKTITSQWDGYCFPFPEVPGMESNVHMYMKGQEPRALIAVYEVKQKWDAMTDAVVSLQDMKSMFFMDNFFAVPSILAFEFEDRQVFVKVADLVNLKETMSHEGFAYIPKEKLKLLKKEPEKCQS